MAVTEYAAGSNISSNSSSHQITPCSDAVIALAIIMANLMATGIGTAQATNGMGH